MGLTEEYFKDIYRPIEELERGHCVVSYLARDEVSGMEVVVDVVEVEKSASPHLAGRLREVLDLAREFIAPCIVPLFSWWEEEGHIYMVRERVKGVELSEILSEVRDLPMGQVIDIARAATQALAQAYGRGLFYLGLNPGQFILDRRGEVRLIRVGYGWLLEEMETIVAARVSPYRAPETDGGKEGTRTSDVYSLAAMIKEMVPRGEGSDRLRSLLERSTTPLPKHRPSSPRLLLEGLEESQTEAGGLGDMAAPAMDKEIDTSTGGLGRDLTKDDTALTHHISLKKHRRGSPLRTLLLILLGGVMVWILYAAVSGSLAGGKKELESPAPVSEEQKVTLPDLQGFALEEAEEALRELGLRVSSREAPSRLWSAGYVAAQEPQEGSVLERGDTVFLVVSSGREESPQKATDGETEDVGTPPTGSDAGETQPCGDSGGSPPPAGGKSPPVSSPRPEPAAPRALAVLSAHRGTSPLYVVMDASSSHDPDGIVTRYIWDCGDGTVLEGARIQHVYDPPVTPMRYQVVLRVYDRDGLSGSCAATVEVY
jgi:hypothetical protein